jgi:catechol 2,3-dioxygenase-like lactoylglutathione lyase family enzyme
VTVIIDHVGLKVRDYDKSKAFYSAALGALGIQLLAEFAAEGQQHGGYGNEAGTSFWISSGKVVSAGDSHVAFAARSRAEVHAFYTIALAAGGRDNGAPGIRQHYHPDYYAAFVFDPDGHNIEAVFVGKEGQA